MTDPYASLRVPDFRRFIAFLLAQTISSTMLWVAVGWQLYQVTHDPLALGIVGPAVGGLLVAAFGLVTTYAAAALLIAIAWVAMFRVSAHPPADVAKDSDGL